MPATKKAKLPEAVDAVRDYLAKVGSLGGKQRAKNLSSMDLENIARMGARARWKSRSGRNKKAAAA